MKATTEQNKRLVLEAFDTLFNKRDYEAAQRYWSPNYIQHSAHIEPGRDGLFNLVRSCASKTESFKNTGMCFRTRPPRNSPGAKHRCSGRVSRRVSVNHD